MRGKASLTALVAALATAVTVPAVVEAATVLKSRMTGAQIVNADGGSPRGIAQATLTVNELGQRICFEIAYEGLGGKAIAGYLREGAPGQMARPTVTLFAGRLASPARGCVEEVPPRVLTALRDHPARHYVDLATRRYPKGAVRGQLRGGEHEEGLAGPPSGGIGRP
jgi:hypothetical protein